MRPLALLVALEQLRCVRVVFLPCQPVLRAVLGDEVYY